MGQMTRYSVKSAAAATLKRCFQRRHPFQALKATAFPVQAILPVVDHHLSMQVVQGLAVVVEKSILKGISVKIQYVSVLARP